MRAHQNNVYHIYANFLFLFIPAFLEGMHAHQTVVLERTDEFSQAPSYRCFKGTPLDPSIIGHVASQNNMPQEDLSLVKEWRDHNKGLLRTLTDFKYPNAQWKEKYLACKQLLLDNGIHNTSKCSYIFELPLTKKYFIQITGPVHRVCTIKAQHKVYEQTLDAEALNALGKSPTFQTVSRFAYYLRYVEEAEKNAFNHFHIPPTYLLALDDTIPLNNYYDSTCFVIQEERKHNPVYVREHKDRIENATSGSFYELLVAIRALGLWDLGGNLLIDENNNFCTSDIEQPNNEPALNFFHRDPWLYAHQIMSGFQSLNNLFEGNIEKQRAIQAFIRNMEPLPNEAKQRELEITLKIYE